MELIRETTTFELDGEYAAAIGKFDGIHKGHQALLAHLFEQKKKGRRTAVFTFDPTPPLFFGRGDYKGLTTRDEKRRIFQRLQVDVLVEFPLNGQTAAIEPEEFIEQILVRRLHTVYLAAGADVTFGRGGRGDGRMLVEYGKRLGFEAAIIDKICQDGREISSSRIRREVEEGHMEKVRELIGFPYSVTGAVAHGRKLGRTLGMPTVNLLPPPDKLLPPNGVYLSRVSYRGRHYKGISNIGCKPTVSEEGIVSVETYLYDFNEEIYGQRITVSLLRFLRPEMRFPSLEALKAQIQKDMEEAK